MKNRHRLLSITLAIIVSITMISPWQANDIAAFAKGDVSAEASDVNDDAEAANEEETVNESDAAGSAGDSEESEEINAFKTPDEIDGADSEQADRDKPLPDNIPAAPRKAVSAVAKSQIGGTEYTNEDDAVATIYGALLGDESIAPWDAAFALFALHHAGIIDVTAKYNSIPIDIDSDSWVKTLRDNELLTSVEDFAPAQGDLVFLKKGNGWSGVHAAIVTYVKGEKFFAIGATTDEDPNAVVRNTFEFDDVIGFVSLETIAPEKFEANEEVAEEEQKDAEEAAEADANTAEEDAEEDASAEADTDKKADADAKNEKAKADEEKAADEDADASLKLTEQTIKADMVAGPGFGGKLSALGRSLTGAERNTVIKLSGKMPEGAVAEAYPVKVEVPGQNVLAAYDIKIFAPVLDKDGQVTDEFEEWQPEEALNVVIRNDVISDVAADSNLNVFHMKNEKAAPKEVGDVEVQGNTATFSAESFSIYAVTEEEETQSVEYKFWLAKADSVVGGRTPYRTISIADGEQLLEPAAPTDASKGKFLGWKYVKDDSSVAFPVTAEYAAAQSVDIYAEFDGAQYATFMSLPTGTSRTVYHTAALTKQSNETYSIDLSTVPEYGAPVGYRFVGWTTQRPTDAKGYGENVAKGNYHKDTIANLDGSVTLYPVCKKVFNISFNGNGGLVQNLPVYKVLVTNDDTWSDVLAKVNNVTRTGYSKNNGWFDGPGNNANPVTFSGDVTLTEDTSYYAHWNAETTKVTVKYWKEDVDKDAQGNSKYFFMDEEEFTVDTESELTVNKGSMTIDGKTLNFNNILTAHSNGGDKVSGSGSYTSDSDMKYFYVEEVSSVDINGNRYVDAVNTSESTTNKTFTVAEDGSTIVNVWFDRAVYKLRFTIEIHSTAGDARVTDFWGSLHDISKRFPNSGYYEIRLGEDLSSKWPDQTADSNNVNITTSTGWRITSMGKRDTSTNSYPDAVHSGGFAFPLSEVNAELLNWAGSDKTIDLWARYEKKLTGGLTASVVNEYYEQFGTTNYKLKKINLFRKTTGEGAISGQTARSYTGYELDLTKTAQNNSAGFNTNTRVATYNNNNTVNFYYKLKDYTVNLNWGNKELASESDIKYTQPIGAYLEGKQSLSSIYNDPTAAARAEGLPEYMEFKGWYIDEEFTERYEFHEDTTMPAHTYSLYARFEPKAITVSIDNCKDDADETRTNPDLNMSGSELSLDVRKLEYVNPDNPTTSDPVKYRAHEHTVAEFLPTYWTTPVQENHVFKGWKISYNGGDSWEDLRDLNEIVDTSVKLKAEWQDMTKHSIHYKEEGKEVYLDTNKYVEGCNVIVKGTDTEIYDKTTQTSKVFRYWLASDGTTQYRPGDIIPMGESDITLTAVFETGGSSSGSSKATYTFVVPNGSGWETYYEEIVYRGERLSPPPANPTKQGATFQGWYKDEACKVKFEDFGNVNAPKDTTVYASFQNPYRVTYKGQEDELITVQNYSGDGSECLDTSGVGEHYSFSSEYAVIGWTDHKTTPGEIPSKYYNGLSEDQVTSDMTMYPVLESGNYLYFVTAEDAVQLPAQFYAKSQNLNFTWPDPGKVKRENYTFTGKWYTDAACTHEFNWNTTLSRPTTIYAGWEVNEGVEVKSNYTVAWWIEKADSDGDRDKIDNYYYSNSEVVKDVNVGTQIGKNTTISANGNNGPASNIEHVKGIPQEDRNFFEYRMAKVSYSKGLGGDDVVSLNGNETAAVDKSGKTTLNIFVSRVRYTVTFNLNSSGRITYGGNAVTGTWDIPGGGWLGMPLNGKWPTMDADGNESPKLTITNGQHYRHWAASVGSSAKTTPVVLDRDNLADTTNRKITYTLNTTTSSGTTNVYYRFRDNDQSDYQSTDYNGKNYDQSFDTSGSMSKKDFSGYTYDSSANSGNDYTFYYTRNKWDLIVCDSRTPNSDINTTSVMTGESLNGKVNEEDPCSVYGMTAPEGKEFDAWSRSSESVVPINFANEKMPDYDMYVYAHWRTKTVTVTYVDEADTSLNSITKEINTKFKDFGLEPRPREGYAFDHWEDADTGRRINNNMLITEDIKVVARYKSLTSKPIYYDLNGGSVASGGSPLDNVQLIESGDNEGCYKDLDTYVVGASAPVRALHTDDVSCPPGTTSFAYWNTESDGSGKIYYPTDIVDLSEEEATVLYAIWAPDMSTTLIYDLYYTGKPADVQVKFNDYRDLEDGELKVNDNYLVGTKYDSTSKKYVDITYSVGTGDTQQTLKAGALRPGYTLLGWTTEEGSETPQYQNGDKIRATSYKNEDGTYMEMQTLYAIWDEQRLPIDVYEYEDDAIGDAVHMNEGKDGYLLTDVTSEAQTPGAVEEAYRTQLGTYEIDNGYIYQKAMVGSTEIDQLQYVLKADRSEYEWQYHVKGGNEGAFTPLGAESVKVYYNKATPVDLTVTNTIAGQYADMTRNFAYTVSGLSSGASYTYQKQKKLANGSYENMDGEGASGTLPVGSDGKITFNLGHGQKIVIKQLPKNAEITVAEEGVSGYTTKYKVDNESEVTATTTSPVKLKHDTTVAFTNTFDDESVVPSGIRDNMHQFMLLLLLLALFSAGFFWIRRRRVS